MIVSSSFIEEDEVFLLFIVLLKSARHYSLFCVKHTLSEKQSFWGLSARD